MAVITPPAYLQAGTYDAIKDRQYLVTSHFQPGTNPLQARSGVLNGHDNISGNVGISGLNITLGPARAVVNTGFAANSGEVLVASLANELRVMGASSPTLNRIDTIGIQVRDAFYSGAFSDADVIIVPGTAVAGAPAPPTRPNGFIPFWDLLLNANATTPTPTDVRKRTGLLGTPVVLFPNQTADAGIYAGEEQYLAASGVMPLRKRVWGNDGIWHGIMDFSLAMGSWVIGSSTADRIIASLSVPDPGYTYRLFWSGAVWASFDGNNGWRFPPRQGTGAAGTVLGGQGGWEVRDPDNSFSGTQSVPITGASGNLTGAQTISLWAQRKFGAGTQGCALSSESQVNCLVVPV